MQRVPQVDRWLDDLRAYRRLALDTNVVIYLLEGTAIYNEGSIGIPGSYLRRVSSSAPNKALPRFLAL